ncbi:unnamed protein product [Rhodiola kirilowii]
MADLCSPFIRFEYHFPPCSPHFSGLQETTRFAMQ